MRRLAIGLSLVVGFIAAPGAVHLLIVSPTTQAISQLPLALIPIVYSFVIFKQKKNKLPDGN